MVDVIVGIDLGTTNSEIAYIKDGQPHVIPDETGDPILPSVVGLAEDGRLLVGHTARNRWLLAPERTVKSIKRHMGEETTVHLGDQEYTPQEISAVILRRSASDEGLAKAPPTSGKLRSEWLARRFSQPSPGSSCSEVDGKLLRR